MFNLINSLLRTSTKKGTSKTLQTGIKTDIITTTRKIETIVVVDAEEVETPFNKPLAFLPLISQNIAE